MNYYVCPKCVDNERSFNTFYDLRLHVEYDHGLWCLGKAMFANESNFRPVFHHGSRELSNEIKDINIKYEQRHRDDSAVTELKFWKMYQDLISIMAERDELDRQLQLVRMDSDVIKAELREKIKLNTELQNVIDEAYKHESRGRKRIESYFEELISLLIKSKR